MITHVVLYRPRAGLHTDAVTRFTAAIVSASREIPGLRRFSVGRQLVGGPAYRQGPFPDFPFAAIVEFATRDELLAYLQHPAHVALGQAFAECAEATLVYDYEMADASEAGTFLR